MEVSGISGCDSAMLGKWFLTSQVTYRLQVLRSGTLKDEDALFMQFTYDKK